MWGRGVPRCWVRFLPPERGTPRPYIPFLPIYSLKLNICNKQKTFRYM